MIKKNFDLVLYDGVCVFCNYWVNYIIKNDKKNQFRFSQIQSNYSKKILNEKNITVDINSLDSIYVITKKNKVLCKYKASTYVLKEVNKIFLILYFFNSIMPKKILNFFYDFVGARRYKIFGKYDECIIPNKEITFKVIP